MEQKITAEDITSMFVALSGVLEKIKKLTAENIVEAIEDKKERKNNANKKYYETNKDAINEARKARYAEKKAAEKAAKEAEAQVAKKSAEQELVKAQELKQKVVKKKAKVCKVVDE